jgi:hypothetical protein
LSSRQTAAAAPGYSTGHERVAARSDFSGGLPSSILPTHAMARQSSAAPLSRPVTATSHAPAMSHRAASPAMAGGHEMSPAPQMTVGHAAPAPSYATTATARKVDEADVSAEDTWTKPVQTQTMSRPSQQPLQPRAMRHGNTFIPPKPVDPRIPTAPAGDLFEGKTVAAQPRAPQAAEKPVKKSPSLFERFTMQRHEEAPAAPVVRESAPKLSVEDGGKRDEDELDIPAFLRRQAN